jgi:5-methylcytosine-specific restriction endonuclease McrA
MCLKVGRVEVANEVHHIKPINEGGAAFPTLDELMSLCKSCHSAIRKQGDAMLVKGCDVFGNPLDKSHPWYCKTPKR